MSDTLNSNISMKIDPNGDGKDFDAALKQDGLLMDDGQLEFIVKKDGTMSGEPLVMICFGVQLPDGTMAKAQTVTTLALLEMAVDTIKVSKELTDMRKGMN